MRVLRSTKWVAAVIAMGGVGWWAWGRVSLPDIPQPTLGKAADPVAKADLAKVRELLINNPRSAAAWGDYGVALRAYEFHPEADLAFRTAWALDPADIRWPYLLGDHLAASDPVAAVSWFRHASVARNPAEFGEVALFRYLEACLAVDRLDDARAILKRLPTASPRAKMAAARLAIAGSDDRRALELLEELTEHPVVARQVATLQSQIYLRQNRPSYSLYISQRGKMAPDGEWPDPITDPVVRRDQSRTGRLNEAARLLREGRPSDAAKILQPLTVTATDAQPFVGLAEAKIALGDRQGATSALEAGLKLEPRNVAANFQLGLRRFEEGEQLWAAGQRNAATQLFQLAITYFDTALAVDPDFGKAILLKGVACQRFLGRPDEGVDWIRRFIKLRPDVGEGYYLLGGALADQRKYAEAKTAFQQALRLAPPGDRRAAESLAKLPP